MPLINTFKFTKTIVEGKRMIENFGNDFIFISSRPYIDKRGELPPGFTATVQVTKDKTDYGVDSKTGMPRDNNVLQTYDVTVLDGTDGRQFKKGQHVRLHGFRQDVSYAIGFDMIIRVDGMEAIKNA